MGVFDVLSKVTGGGGDEPSATDADDAGDGSESVADGFADPADYSPADFREGAETLAGRSDVPELDFTEASLSDLDAIATGNHPVDDPTVYGSYLGETLVRAFDGEWVRDDGWAVAVDHGDDRTTVAVFDAARMALDRGPVFERVAQRLHEQGDPCAGGEATADDESGDDSTADDQVERTAGTADADSDDVAATDDFAEGDCDAPTDAAGDESRTGRSLAEDHTVVIDAGSEGDEPAQDDTAADDGTTVDEATSGDEDGENPDSQPSAPTEDGSHTDERSDDQQMTELDRAGPAEDEPTDGPGDDDQPSPESGDVDRRPISEEIADLGPSVRPTADASSDGGDGGAQEGEGEATAEEASGNESGEPDVAESEAHESTASESEGDEAESGVTPAGTADAETGDDEGDEEAAGDAAAIPARSDYAAVASEFADAWANRDFDFSPTSLVHLDRFLDDQWDGRFRPGSLEDSATDPAEGGGPLVRAGAYVGEVLVRHYDGEWVPGEDGEPAVAVAGRNGREETFDVFEATRRSLVHPARIAYEVDALAHRLDVERSATGAVDSGFAVGDGEAGTAASSAAVITTILDRAERFVDAWPASDLDYRPASLARLDTLVDRELDTAAYPTVTLGDWTDPDALRLADTAAGIGAYYAAVLVRHLGAQWEIGDEVALVVEGPAGTTRVRPFPVAVDRLRGRSELTERYGRVHDAVRIASRGDD